VKKSLVTINVDNIKSVAIIHNRVMGAFLVERLSYPADNYRHTKAFKEKRWDGKIRFAKYSYPYLTFPTGLLMDVVKLFKRNNIEPIFKDTRIQPKKEFELEYLGSMRDYQEEALIKAIEAQRGILWHVTGAGKTELFMNLIAELGVPTLILVNNTEIMKQTAQRCLDSLGLETIGLIGGGVVSPTKLVTVGMLQTLNSLKESDSTSFKTIANHYKMLIVDEAHHINANAKTYTKIINAIPAFYRYAFTGTPIRSTTPTATDITLIASFGPVIDRVTREELVEKGYLVPAKVVIIKLNTSHHTLVQDYLESYASPQEAYRAALTELLAMPERMEALKEIKAKHPDEQILYLTTSVEYAERIGAEVGAVVVHGGTDSAEREYIYKQFKSGGIKCLVATNIYSEGVDFPKLAVVVLAEPFKSVIRLLQKIGRAMRVSEGKERCVIYDFNDLPFAFFDEQFSFRMKTYAQEGIPVEGWMLG